jgi:DNA-binding NtrC family response regulator
VKVLVLEDDPLVREGLIATLTHLGHEGLCTSTIEGAQALIHRHEDVEVALADAGLRCGQLGVDFLRWLKSARPAIARVLISGVESAGAVEVSAAVQRFVKKPFGLVELAEVLRSPRR